MDGHIFWIYSYRNIYFLKTEDSGHVDLTPTNMALEPPLDWSTVDSLFKKFDGIIRGFCDVDLLSDARKSTSNVDQESFDKVRKLIKHVADIIWNTLSKSHYKDKPHLQSIYSYLTGYYYLNYVEV